eukprot:GHVU01086781.1.p2 GENE.GHVU01086781.1~~GHVU01086781.1.p2  ORF type:complete len:152 (+),score=12.61 GHVU01086781.1:2401-2856(+)
MAGAANFGGRSGGDCRRERAVVRSRLLFPSPHAGPKLPNIPAPAMATTPTQLVLVIHRFMTQRAPLETRIFQLGGTSPDNSFRYGSIRPPNPLEPPYHIVVLEEEKPALKELGCNPATTSAVTICKGSVTTEDAMYVENGSTITCQRKSPD